MINPHDHQVYAVKELTNLTLEDGSTDEVDARAVGGSAQDGGRRVRVHRPVPHVRGLWRTLLRHDGAHRKLALTLSARVAARVR